MLLASRPRRARWLGESAEGLSQPEGYLWGKVAAGLASLSDGFMGTSFLKGRSSESSGWLKTSFVTFLPDGRPIGLQSFFTAGFGDGGFGESVGESLRSCCRWRWPLVGELLRIFGFRSAEFKIVAEEVRECSAMLWAAKLAANTGLLGVEVESAILEDRLGGGVGSF